MDSRLIVKTRHLLITVIAVFAFWTIGFVGLLSWTISSAERHVTEYAQMEAKANFNKDIAFRNWATERGGVYVPVSESTPPNPYLSHIPERDIVTSEGQLLTLMNPAYMLRQTMAEFSELYGIKGRITSLKPLNPGNTPDEWERKVLEMFDGGVKEFSEFTSIEGKPYLRYMQAFITREGCLKCHKHQGYQVGNVRGGVGVSVPIEPYLKVKDETIYMAAFSYGIIWLIGVLGIGFGYFHVKRRIRHQYAVEQALSLAKDKAERLSQFDGLTGLRNRRYLDEQLPIEIKRAAREKQALGLLMIDIDWFKLYNDSQGHLAGDDALKKVAKSLHSVIQRPADLVARYGGEEFCVLLPKTHLEGVKEIAEKLRSAVEALHIPVESQGAGRYITISVGGVSMTPTSMTTPEMLIERADKALFHAKHSGKNEVVIQDDADS